LRIAIIDSIIHEKDEGIYPCSICRYVPAPAAPPALTSEIPGKRE
jgi:hypothetical protein